MIYLSIHTYQKLLVIRIKRKIDTWTIEELVRKRDLIQFPVYQREPNVWNEKKKILLIDSIMHGIDMPTIYLFKQEDGSYDCVDGRQRIGTILSFFNGELDIGGEESKKYWDDLDDSSKKIFEEYQMSVAIIEDASDDDLRKLFLRLQLGLPLNSGEKLNAMTGDMHDLVFKLSREHPFFTMISIPSKRFSKEQLCSQILINSFYLQQQNVLHSARFEDLEEFFDTYKKLEKYQSQVKKTKKILDTIFNNFNDNLKEIKNRSLALSIFVFVYKLDEENKLGHINQFVKFYPMFARRLREESAKGFDFTNRYLVEFQKYVTQASSEAYQIENRHRGLKKFFDFYLKTGKIFGDS